MLKVTASFGPNYSALDEINPTRLATARLQVSTARVPIGQCPPPASIKEATFPTERYTEMLAARKLKNAPRSERAFARRMGHRSCVQRVITEREKEARVASHA